MEPQNKQIDRVEFVSDVIAKLRYFAQLYGIDSLFVAGGYCRSLYFNKLSDVHDIDVASAYEHQAVQMAGLFGSEVMNVAPEIYQRSQTAMIEYKSGDHSIKIEFQGKSCSPYMYNQEIRDWMHNNGLEDEPLVHNVYGRDFTINSLVYSLHNGHIYDITDRATKDLEEGNISSLLPAEFLIKYNPLASLRALRFSIYYGFKIDEELESAMHKAYPLLRESLSEDRITQELLRILTIDAEKAIDYLKKYELDRLLLIPMVREKVKEES